MKRYLVWFPVVVGVVLAGVLVGCSTISSVGNLISGITGNDTEADTTQGGSDSGAVASASGTGNSAVGPVAANRLQAMQANMLFTSTYYQVFFIGGYDPAGDDFQEGEGVTWAIRSSQDRAADSATIVRALLKRESRGSWWYMALESDGQVIEYEVLLDADYAPLEMVWADPDSGQVLRQVFEPGQVAGPGTGEESGAMVYSSEAESLASRTTERVTVPAGSYSAEHVVFRASDYQSGEQVEYNWWVVESVPGNLVKFEYVVADGSGEELLSGELTETRTDYRTKFASY